MIKNAKLLAVSTAVSVLALTACGGGGGGGSSDSGVSVNQPTKPSAVSKLEIDGNIALVGGKTYGKTIKYTKSDDVDILIVDGKKFLVASIDDTLNNTEPGKTKRDTFKQGVDYDGVAPYSDHFATGWTIVQNYSTFGGYVINPSDTDGFNNYKGFGAYYQGYLTPEGAVPKNGTVTYTGAAIVYNTKTLNDDKYTNSLGLTANTRLTADFDKRELTGTITIDDHYLNRMEHLSLPAKSEIYAKITGNTFAGSKNNVSTEGKFFGPKAEEVAGTFQDKQQNIGGVFGAKSK